MDTRILLAILSKDSKDTTYKFALLRAMVQCVTDQQSHRKKSDDGWVAYPMGLLVYYWILYYYPIFSNRNFIPQKNGENPSLSQGKTIAFRRQFNLVIDYYEIRGGLMQFKFDLIQGEVPGVISREVLILLKSIRRTIRNMPMRHLGVYQFGKHYSLVYSGPGSISKPSFKEMILSAGMFYINPELHDLILQTGSLLTGEDSIIDEWADFTVRAAKRMAGSADLSKERVLTLLTQSTEIERDVTRVKNLLHKESEEGLTCIWSGQPLNRYEIDHAIPFSLWQNNHLWNLVPVTPKINSKKSDKIPSPQLIHKSASRIRHIWSIYLDSYGEQFENEVFEALGAGLGDGMDHAIQSLMQKSEYLIEYRGFQKFDL